jgi:hypothetical protein
MPAVSLAGLVSALQFAAPGKPVRIDTQTGDVIPSDEAVGPGSVGEVQRDGTIKIRLDEMALAKSFCATVTDPQNRKRLETALLSARPVEAFERALYRSKIAYQWFPFRDLELVRLAKAQLEAQGIPFVDDLA